MLVGQSLSFGMPTRLVARQISELLLTRMHRWRPVIGHDRVTAMLFSVVLNDSTARQPYKDPATGQWIGILQACTAGRPIGSSAIARSLGLSETTARRKLNLLVGTGLIERRPRGLNMSQVFCADPRIDEICAENASDLARVLGTITRSGYASLEENIHALGQVPPLVTERLIIKFQSRMMESVIALYGDFTSSLIIAATIAANISHVTRNPALSAMYAHEESIPPDDIRQPIAIRALASASDLPFETVRRRAVDLVEKGLLVSRGGGVLVPAKVLSDPRQLENNRRIVMHFEQMVSALRMLGGGETVAPASLDENPVRPAGLHRSDPFWRS